MMADSF